jgi:quinol monooxygenase YgiN
VPRQERIVIVVTGFLTLNPDHRDTAVDAVRTLVAATRAEEGNEEYRYSWDLDDPNRLNIEERWADQDSMDAHMVAPHFASFMEVIGPCIGGDVSITKFDVAGSTKIF